MKVLGWLFLIVLLFTGNGCNAPTAAPTVVEVPIPTATLTATQPATAVPEPTSTPTPSPLAGAACLPGNWQPADLRGQMERSLKASRPGVTVDSLDGLVAYRFSADGSFELAFEQFEVKLSGESNGKTYHTGSLLNGSASARYQADEAAGQLTLSDFGGEGVRLTATVNGQPLFEENLSAWPAFFASLAESVGAGQAGAPPDGEARLNFDCLENRLVLSRTGQPAADLELVRMP